MNPILIFSRLLLLAILTFLLVGCREAAELDAIPPMDQADFLEEEVETADPSLNDFSELSLYAYSAAWTNQDGGEQMLSSFRGRPVVMSMIFTSCSYACPMIVNDMKRLAERLPESAQMQVQYVLVSVDPERDTPEVLRHFAEAHGLDLRQWTLLRGDPEKVRTLAALLGVKYSLQADGQYAHTSVLSVLNEGGELVYQMKGVGGGTEGASSALQDLVVEVH